MTKRGRTHPPRQGAPAGRGGRSGESWRGLRTWAPAGPQSQHLHTRTQGTVEEPHRRALPPSQPNDRFMRAHKRQNGCWAFLSIPPQLSIPCVGLRRPLLSAGSQRVRPFLQVQTEQHQRWHSTSYEKAELTPHQLVARVNKDIRRLAACREPYNTAGVTELTEHVHVVQGCGVSRRLVRCIRNAATNR